LLVHFCYFRSWYFHSSSQLKRLGLVRCYGVSDEGLSGVAAKLPLLEELSISYCKLSKEALEAVGHCCPHLKSLKFNSLRYGKFDEEAFAVAVNMSELRSLQLFGNMLTKDGLQAILGGCHMPLAGQWWWSGHPLWDGRPPLSFLK
jgi:hypothetical protein